LERSHSRWQIFLYSKSFHHLCLCRRGAYKTGNGFNIIAAHTDSPNLRVKPVSKRESSGYIQLSVEPYGGGLWHTWFDRDLTLAGRVIVRNADGSFKQRLVHVKRPILRIPNLAIHLTKGDERTSFTPNTQEHLGYPVLASKVKGDLESSGVATATNSHSPLLLKLLASELKVNSDQISDFELSVCDFQSSTKGGMLNEFIFSPRLDNLCMSFCGIHGLIDAVNKHPEALKAEKRVLLVALFDNEEIGSESAYGAASSMMRSSITRIVQGLSKESLNADIDRVFANSFLISADMAHAVHPNYSSRHDDNHKPAIHSGPVIKFNANQRYATTTVTAFLFKELCRAQGVPFQEFVVRNDSPCGSTIGPILSSNCGIRTVDMGLPQLSMHSIREMCGVADVNHACHLFSGFFSSFTKIDEKLKVDG